MAADDAAAPQKEGAAAEVTEANGVPEGTPDLTHAVPTPPEPLPEPPEPTVEPEAKAEAAIAEGGPVEHKVTFKLGESELEVQLPKKLKMSVMFRAGVLRDNDGQGASRLIQAVLGDEQFDQVLDIMDAEGQTTDDEEGMTAVGNLLNDALATYGVTPGESQAS